MMGLKQIFKLETQHLSKSVLLEESGAAAITKVIVAFALLVFSVFLVWSFITTVDEVSIAKGEILPEEGVRRIQRLSGGVIQHLFVEEGQLISKGQLLIQLENPQVRAQFRQLQAKQQSLQAHHRRLRRYLEAIGTLKKQPTRLGDGNNAPDNKTNSQFSIDQDEILKMLLVYHKMRREAFQNQVGQYKSKMVEMGENTDNLKELANVDEKLALVNSELVLAKEKLASLSITSPILGIVHGLNAGGTGSVVAPGAVLMEVVPKNSRLFAQVRISAKDIGHVRLDQPVHLKFTTYDYSRYGSLVGHLSEISATSFINRRGIPYYKAIVRLHQRFLDPKNRLEPILPGMTVEANIITGKKTIIEYLLKPVFSSSQRALRER